MKKDFSPYIGKKRKRQRDKRITRVEFIPYEETLEYYIRKNI